ncbi:uncharacterized protein MELLADRAFT_92374 [Melampsora larici-populina 98AG31]|uniref:Uncharacterized protein n=1 Tax=Melampsora larici-populina (strain 98AG31 / pathotype 3-4-7) TaxID=747676 RepID=F4R9E2_MELLP|nr:uncharacterized protein MELLADRAFT_92374 [Melampsora larici-populina 98AG31]EGG11170.1 hypothetical protein MELLADRAFT_92374 [Melampsora larici-populina 98AG31]
MSRMLTIPNKISPIQSRGAKIWARSVRQIDALGALSKNEMTHVHSIVRRHLRVLMCRDSEASPIPPTLSAHEQKDMLERFPEGQPLPHGTSMPMIDVTDFEKTGVHLSPHRFEDLELELKRWGLRRFSFKWEADLEERVNVLAQGIFWNSFYNAIKNRYYNFSVHQDILRLEIIMPVFKTQFKRLSFMYHEQCSNNKILDGHYKLAEKKKIFKEYADYLIKCGAARPLASIFQPRNYLIMGDIAEVQLMSSGYPAREVHYVIPRWWSEQMIAFIKAIEARVHFAAQSRNADPQKRRSACKFISSSSNEYGFIPRHLPADMYSEELKNSLPIGDLWELKMKPSVLPAVGAMDQIFPGDAGELVQHSLDGVDNEQYTSDDDISDDEIYDIHTDQNFETSYSIITKLEDFESRVQTQISTLRGDLDDSIKKFSNLTTELNGLVPLRLEELNKAKDDITNLYNKLGAVQGKLGIAEEGNLSNDAAEAAGPAVQSQV